MLRSRRSTRGVASLVVALLAVFTVAIQGSAAANEPAPPSDEQQLLWRRYAAQQAELDQLRAQFQAQSGPVTNASFETLSLDSRMTETRTEEAEPDAGYEVGSDLKMNARWDINNGIVFETPHKD